MVSYADLGGLGAREGTPVVHTWEPPPPEPPEPLLSSTSGLNGFSVLLWLLMLLPLFLFRANRSRQAWWIWLPVVISGVAGIGITCLMSGSDWSLAQAIASFTVGLAALWLLMPFLGSRYRIVACLKALPVLAGFSLLAYVPTLLASHSDWLDLRPYLAGLLALGSLVAILALSFGGLVVRRRFGRIRFTCWVAVWTLLAWAIIVPLYILFIAQPSHVEWREVCLPVLGTCGVTLALLLPPVLLSFFQPFYRARFFGWLNLPQAGPAAEAAIPPRMDTPGLSSSSRR